MSETKASVDYERLHEFRLLVECAPPLSEMASHSCAIVIWNRLWTDLFYESEVTHDPGRLTVAGARLYYNSLTALGIGLPQGLEIFMEMLVNCRILRRDGEDFFCDRFARLNPSRLTDRYVKGNKHSVISKNNSNYRALAQTQMLLVDPSACKRKDGTEMSKAEVEGCLWLVRCLDGALEQRTRPIEKFNEGLMADAVEVLKNFPDRDLLMPVLYWLSDNANHANLPRSAELLLANWESVMALRRKTEQNAALNFKAAGSPHAR